MKNKRAGFLRSAVAGVFCGVAACTQAGETVPVMVKYRADATPEVIERLEKEMALPRVRVLPTSGLYIYRTDSNADAAALAQRLAANPAVESAEVDQIVRISPKP